MAAIDKIYGTAAEYAELRAWLEVHLPEGLTYLYSPPPPGAMREWYPLSNFPERIDAALWLHCPLAWVRERLREQYPTRPPAGVRERVLPATKHRQPLHRSPVQRGYGRESVTMAKPTPAQRAVLEALRDGREIRDRAWAYRGTALRQRWLVGESLQESRTLPGRTVDALISRGWISTPGRVNDTAVYTLTDAGREVLNG